MQDRGTMKSGYILNNFCVYVQNHVCKPIKRQNYNIISLLSTKYINRKQTILLWKNSRSLKKKYHTIFVEKKKNADVSKKKAPSWLVAIWNKSYYSCSLNSSVFAIED